MVVLIKRSPQLSEEKVDAIFHALADRTRRDIVSRVIEREQSVSSLSSAYAISFAATQKHVAVLERAELVTKRRRGREQIVHSRPGTIRSAAELLEALESLWLQRAARMRDILADDPIDRASPADPTNPSEEKE